jgi:hypothetical protein
VERGKNQTKKKKDIQRVFIHDRHPPGYFELFILKFEEKCKFVLESVKEEVLT